MAPRVPVRFRMNAPADSISVSFTSWSKVTVTDITRLRWTSPPFRTTPPAATTGAVRPVIVYAGPVVVAARGLPARSVMPATVARFSPRVPFPDPVLTVTVQVVPLPVTGPIVAPVAWHASTSHSSA